MYFNLHFTEDRY